MRRTRRIGQPQLQSLRDPIDPLPRCEVENLEQDLQMFLSLQIALPKTKIEIASTKSKYNLFTHYYKDIIEHSNTQIRLSVRFENNKSCIFFIKKFALHRSQLILTEIVNHIHSET